MNNLAATDLENIRKQGAIDALVYEIEVATAWIKSSRHLFNYDQSAMRGALQRLELVSQELQKFLT